jgi:hypothetical protein
MHPEAAFLAGYALALTLLAVGLEWLGRRSTDPWASRTLAACRPPTQQPAQRPSDESPDWPHSEVPAFHLGLAAVALTAAFAITALSTVRYVGTTELAVHSALLVVISVRTRHVIIESRTTMRRLLIQSTPTALSDPEPTILGRTWQPDAELERDV